MNDLKRWRGLRALVGAAVEQGASAIERVHLETARRPFSVLEQIPGVAEPVQVVHQVHDTVVSGAYGAVRLVNRAVGTALDAALDALDTGPDEQDPGNDARPEASAVARKDADGAGGG